MRAPDRLRRAAACCFRTRRRTQLTVLLTLAVGWLAWSGVGLVRAAVARAAAERALAAYDFPTARARLAEAVRLRPRYSGAWLLAAQAARRAGDLPAAKSHLDRFCALAGVTAPDGRLEQRLQLAQQGQAGDDAADLLKLVDDEHPDAEQILEALALGENHIYRFDRAGLLLDHLLTRFPRNPIGRLLRARLAAAKGRREVALGECRALLADFPESWDARLLLAGLVADAQEFAPALEQYERLRAGRPDDATAALGLARCLEGAGRRDEARALWEELADRFPDRGDVQFQCGRFALQENRPADAERLLRRAVELAPHDSEAEYQLGLCADRLGQAAEAQRHFERFKRIEADLRRFDSLMKAVIEAPQDPAPRREAGLVCVRNGRTAEGLRWLRGALGIAPADKATHAALADCYRALGNAALADYHREQAR
jgi:tetratricopeptide (TPR) repeat protein